MTPSEALAQVCSHLRLGDQAAAAATLTNEYPFAALKKVRRSATKRTSTSVFLRDGFIDRYSGERLIFPGALRLVALKIPDAFPYHLNWKMSETHLAVWQLSATIDGGKDT